MGHIAEWGESAKRYSRPHDGEVGVESGLEVSGGRMEGERKNGSPHKEIVEWEESVEGVNGNPPIILDDSYYEYSF